MVDKGNSLTRHAVSVYLAARSWAGRNRYGPAGPTGTRIKSNKVIKGPCEPTELAALQYIAKHTSIPVPKVQKVRHSHRGIYLETDYIPGRTLEEAWLGGDISDSDKERIIGEIADYIGQLRGLRPPRTGIVASASLDACLDNRVRSTTFGPFPNHSYFHCFLRGSTPLMDCTENFGPEVTACHSRRYRSKFAHANICPSNVIVDDDAKIVAIIDWRFSGWYPEYWEYTKMQFAKTDIPEWHQEIKFAMKPYEEEWKAEQALWGKRNQKEKLP